MLVAQDAAERLAGRSGGPVCLVADDHVPVGCTVAVGVDDRPEALVGGEHDAGASAGQECGHRIWFGGGAQRQLIDIGVGLHPDSAAIRRRELRADRQGVEVERGIREPRGVGLLQQGQRRHQEQNPPPRPAEQLGHRVHAGDCLTCAARHDHLLAGQ